MIELTSHKVNDLNDAITIQALDEPGHGGAHHDYMITVHAEDRDIPFPVFFQNGPVKEEGFNGLTQEALLAIVEHRLRCFQNGPYACAANGDALDMVCRAQDALHKRTKARMERGVEGTHIK